MSLYTAKGPSTSAATATLGCSSHTSGSLERVGRLLRRWLPAPCLPHGRLRGPHIGPYRNVHADKAGHARQQCADDKSGSAQATEEKEYEHGDDNADERRDLASALKGALVDARGGARI